MSDKIKIFENGLVKDFKTTVTKLEQDLISIADGENIISGTKEKPIVTDSEKVPIRHFFMDGVYIREMTMFKDTFVIGAIHKHLHMCFLLEGHLSVAHEEDVVEYKAPCFIVSKPGIKRLLYDHEKSIWYNTHQNPTNIEDIVQLEKELVCINYKEYEKYINQNK